VSPHGLSSWRLATALVGSGVVAGQRGDAVEEDRRARPADRLGRPQRGDATQDFYRPLEQAFGALLQ